MSLSETINPYAVNSVPSAVCRSLLELPVGVMNLLRRANSGYQPDFNYAQQLLDQVSLSIQDIKNPQVESFITRGFESAVFTFRTKGGHWVLKVGNHSSFTTGLLAPSTNEYAQLQEWNRQVLELMYNKDLPHLLPSPYFVIPPGNFQRPATLQIAPFIEKVDIKSMDTTQVDRLKYERKLFNQISEKMAKDMGALPDLIKPSNLIAGKVDGQPHLVLLDNGLFHLSAPTPILGLCARAALKLSIISAAATAPAISALLPK